MNLWKQSEKKSVLIIDDDIFTIISIKLQLQKAFNDHVIIEQAQYGSDGIKKIKDKSEII